MTPEESSIKLPHPWYYTAEEGEGYHKALADQFRREVAPGYVLCGVYHTWPLWYAGVGFLVISACSVVKLG